jgi:hypothetical protein
VGAVRRREPSKPLDMRAPRCRQRPPRIDISVDSLTVMNQV